MCATAQSSARSWVESDGLTVSFLRTWRAAQGDGDIKQILAPVLDLPLPTNWVFLGMS